ncbi:MAG: NAD(P)/FAD-dependent oxidoreductase, partial [Rhodothermales bacterium]
MDYDVIIIGAGHNGLVAGCYLARAGYRVGVFERRHLVGGAVSTEELVPGYQFDYGGSAHTLIRLTPIVEELELETYGLEYIDLDPIFAVPSVDEEPLYFYRSVDRTVDELERMLPGEGLAYRRFIDDWQPFAETVKDVFLTVPGPFQIGKKMIRGDGPRIGWKDALRTIARPYGEVVDQYFASERLKSALVWMAAQ